MKKIAILSFILLAFSVNAQQEAMFTHYSFNTLVINPAYAGSRDALTVMALHRTQWLNFPGAPKTLSLTAHMPVFSEKIGLGLSFLNDHIGPTRQNAIYADFAYKIRLGRGKLAFGLKAGLNMVNTDLTALNNIQGNDPLFQQDIESKLLPNFGFGLYYSTPTFYIGASTPRLLENNFETNRTTGTIHDEKRHYYLIGGVVFPINKAQTLKLRPTTFIKLTEGAPIELDLTALLYIYDKYWVGPMFRSGDAVGVLIGLQLFENLSFGYSFDWSYGNKTVKYNAGSHEIMLRYDFVFGNKSRIRSPRYF